MKQLQFELWQECGNGCKFCFLGDNNKFTSNEVKLISLKNTLDKISDISIYKEYDTLAYIGGEFFQGQLNTPEIKEKFMELMKKTAWLKDNGYVKNVWIYATMTIGDQKDLYETIDLFNDKNNLWILTSYDTLGRFHTQKMEDTWKYHMKHIHELYPEIKFNVTTILTGDFIEKYLNNDFSFKKMKDEYHCEFFLKHCYLGNYKTPVEMNEKVGNFFPRRDIFLKFLIKFREEEGPHMWDKLFNIKYRADGIYKNFNEEKFVLNNRHKDSDTEDDEVYGVLPCGHQDTYSAYLDCNNCIMCDKHMIEKLYN